MTKHTVYGSCFRMLEDILVSDLIFFLNGMRIQTKRTTKPYRLHQEPLRSRVLSSEPVSPSLHSLCPLHWTTVPLLIQNGAWQRTGNEPWWRTIIYIYQWWKWPHSSAGPWLEPDTRWWLTSRDCHLDRPLVHLVYEDLSVSRSKWV